jgi:3-hydroxybutyryl-CoA dehydratase
MITDFDKLREDDTIDGPSFTVSRESIRLFCDASLDYNPLHLDDDYMKGEFGRTNFGGIIMHGMNNFGLITRMITDWLPPEGVHRRLETRWVKPVRPGIPSSRPLPSRPGRSRTSRAECCSMCRCVTRRATKSRSVRLWSNSHLRMESGHDGSPKDCAWLCIRLCCSQCCGAGSRSRCSSSSRAAGWDD